MLRMIILKFVGIVFAMTVIFFSAAASQSQFAPLPDNEKYENLEHYLKKPAKKIAPKKNKRCYPFDKWYHYKKWIPLYIIVLAVLFIYFSERKDRNLLRRIAQKDKLIDSYENELGMNSLSQKERQEAGEKYEKYIARIYRRNGWTIHYNGLIKGYNDEGIDLICSKKNEPLTLVQCKNWASDKIIHENYIFAVYGAGEYYRLSENADDIKIVFYCTCRMSNQAKIIARKLGIEVHDEFKILSKQ